MNCLHCHIEINQYLGIKSIEPTDPPGWMESVTRPVQLCIGCAIDIFDPEGLEIVTWSEEE